MRRGLRSSRGMTFVETAVAATILVVVLGLASVGTSRVIATRAATTTKSDLELRAQATVERVLDLLTDVSLANVVENLTTTSGSSSLTFRKPQGYAGGAITLGPTISITLDPDANDPVNGVDDDKDGVVDQRVLDMQVGTSAKIPLARHVTALLEGETSNGADDNGNGLVDETGFVVSRSGNAVTVRLTLRRKGPDGTLQTATFTGTTRVSP